MPLICLNTLKFCDYLGVQSVEPELKASQVSVKGTLEPEKLVDFIHKRTGKHAVVVKVEPEKKEEEKKEEEKPKEEKEEKKPEEPEKEVKKDEGGKDKKEGDAEGGAGGGEPPAKAEAEAGDPKLEVKKNELFYYYDPQNFQVYPQMFVQEHYHPYPPPPPPQMLVQENYHAYPPPQMFVQENYHAHPPQFFSDENPNACSVM